MDELYLCSCAQRRMYGRTQAAEPSLFLQEIDKDGLRIIGNAPWNFCGADDERRPQIRDRIPAAANTGKSGWQRGDRLYHDDHGYGAVLEVRDSEEGPVVRVQFETGKEMRFLSEHQGSHFVKIGSD
jgi:DNA helicase-2/ATP-dependent DNA helicase PcrA